MKVSVIIVHYKNQNDLKDCLKSLYKFKSKYLLEVIVVDNSEIKSAGAFLKKEFKEINYIPSEVNIGYGAGMNLGVKNAKGDLLLLLNQDVILKNDIVTKLANQFTLKNNIGMVAPLLYSVDGRILQQGTKELTPLMAIFKLSFLDKYLPNNPISKGYFSKIEENDKLIQSEVVPGTAIMMHKKLYDSLGGFDQNFFLYFEEFDFCNRLRQKGFKNYIDPSSKLIHKWATSTKQVKNINEIFKKSRYYYFKKNYGIIKALMVEGFLRLNKLSLVLILIFTISLLLLLIKVNI
jgi:GT2 family glycosyltransferase